MSTRSNVIVRFLDKQTGKDSSIQFYHHCDGYLDGVGKELFEMLDEANKVFENRNYDTTMEYADYVLRTMQSKEDYELELYGYLHGDIEYLYVIDLNDKKIYYYDDNLWDCDTEDFNEVISRCNKELTSDLFS